MLKFFYLCFGLLTYPFFSHSFELENQKLLGQGKLQYLFVHIYDVNLYTNDNYFSFDKDFALKLEYKIKLHGNKIADISTEKIRALGYKDEIKMAAWHAQMKDIFPDVKEGTSLTGFYKPNQPTVFYKDSEKIGTIKDPEFGKWFFGIWLSEKTSEPKLRQAILGEK